MGTANKTTRALDHKTKMKYPDEANLNKTPLINRSLVSSIDIGPTVFFPLQKGPIKRAERALG